MSLLYSELRERVVQGVIRTSPVSPPLDRIRAVFDACFFQVNSQVSEVFASKDTHRELLRAPKTLTFIAGEADVPTDVLKKYIEDGTFEVTGSPTPHYSYLSYPDYIRTFDKRLGYWSNVGETFKAKKPITGAVLTGVALSTFICSPAVPTSETAEFVAPSDFLPEFIDAATQFIQGQMLEMAAQTA